jgi:glycerol-3-phosphate dehydrogenase (NAD(P)+)
MNSSFQHFGIIGGGAWGTALGQALLRAGRDVTLWARETDVVATINARHENTKFLPGIALNPRLKATGNLEDMVACQAWILVVPTQHLRGVCQQLAGVTKPGAVPVIIGTKGIEQNTLALPSAIVAEVLPSHPLAVLSGPTFATEVARDQPTAMTLASADAELGGQLAQAISSRSFRPYLSGDVTGAQIGGAIKNVLAIACGIATGCGMGENARAALITRGLAEMMRLAAVIGAKHETLMGLSGLGDLILTCASAQSRNMSLGLAMGQGAKLDDILAARSSVAEGVFTASAALALADKHKVDMPIVEAVDAVLNHGASVDASIEALLARPLKDERA